MGYTKSKGLDMQTAKRILPVSLFYNANVAFALASLKGVNIPMYIAIKRLTPLAVLIAGFFSGKARPTTQVFPQCILLSSLKCLSCVALKFDLSLAVKIFVTMPWYSITVITMTCVVIVEPKPCFVSNSGYSFSTLDCCWGPCCCIGRFFI